MQTIASASDVPAPPTRNWRVAPFGSRRSAGRVESGNRPRPAGQHGTDVPAGHLGVTKQASGQLVADLEKRGYVRREDHPQGGRRRLIVLTGKALAHLEAAGAVLHQLESEIAARAGDETLLALRTELARLIRAMTGDGDIPPLRPLW
jgi:hypothetical protein